MRHTVIRYGMIVLLIGLIAMAADRTYAQTQPDNGLVFLGGSFGMTPELTARISVAHLGDGSVRILTPAITTIQILDPEGNVIAQSPELAIPTCEFRSFDIDLLALSIPGEPGTNRVQARIKPFYSFRSERLSPVLASFEIVDNRTGKTVVLSGPECLVFYQGGIPGN